MRCSPSGTCLIASVAIIFCFLQPLAAQDDPGRRTAERYTEYAISESPVEVAPIDIDSERLGHSFYPDLYLTRVPSPSLLVVTELTAAPSMRVFAEFIQAIPREAALLLVAPRRDPLAPAGAAEAMSSVSLEVPRIFVAFDRRAEWRLSTPGRVTPLWLTRRIVNSSTIPVGLAHLNAARLGFGDQDSVLDAALIDGLSAARLRITDATDLRTALEPLAAALETDLLEGPLAGGTNYLVAPLATLVVIPETVLVWGIIAASACMLLYGLVRPRSVRRYTSAIRRNAWPLLLLFVALLASLIAGNLALRALNEVERIMTEPLILAAGKFTIGVLTLGGLYAYLRFRVRRATAVYSGAAIFSLLIGALASGYVSVILSSFFVAALVFGFFFSLAPTGWLKALAFIAAVAPGVYLVTAMTAVADEAFARVLLRPPFERELATAVFIFPLLLMFFRLDSLTPRIPLLTMLVALATVGLAIVSAQLIMEFRGEAPVEIAIREQYLEAGAGFIEVTAAGPIARNRSVSVVSSGGTEFTCDQLPCRRSITARRPPLELTVTSSSALERNTLRWRLAFERPAELMELRLSGQDRFQLYGSTLPFQEPFGSTEIDFTSRPGPMPPLETAGTVVLRPEEPTNEVTLTVFADFTEPTGATRQADGVIVVDHSLGWLVRERVAIE